MPEQSDENETAAVQEQEETGSSVELPSPPSVARTLTFFSPCGAPVHPIGDAIPAGAADELELLVAMFGADRKLRMCEPFDGSHFLLQCDAIEHDASYVILEIILPSCYPECSPLITAPYGVLPGGRTFTSEQMEACAKQCLDCARELADDSTPALCPIFDAARDWLAATADAAAIT